MYHQNHNRLDRLYGCVDIGRILQGDLGLVPWQRHRQPITPEATAGLRDFLAQPVRLFDIDPRLLLASQPKLVRHHFRHYFERGGTDYQWHARTSADERSELNRFPVVEPHDDGRFIIRSGHHRAAVALVRGVPLRCRVVDREAVADAVAVTPRLLVGTIAEVDVFPIPAHNWVEPTLTSEGEAYAAYRIRKHGSTVIMPTIDAAQRVLARLECDPDWAVTLLRRSFPGIELDPIPIHPIPAPPAPSVAAASRCASSGRNGAGGRCRRVRGTCSAVG